MKKFALAIVTIVAIGYFLLRREPQPVHDSRERVTDEQPSLRPELTHKLAPNSDASEEATSQKPFESQAHEVVPSVAQADPISVDAAGEMAFSTGDIAHQMFELNEVSENRAPPGPNEAKVFRGLIKTTPTNEIYIEMRFDGDKWVVSSGSSRNELSPWPRRDVIPFPNQPDIWTLYFENSQGLFLKHIPKVNIPELNGDFEVLSGWLTTPTKLTHMALIGYSESWPPEAVVARLFPHRP